jgi:hypothetical protein
MAASSPLDQHASPVSDHGTSSGKATAALVVGIIGILLTLLFWPVGIILDIVAIVLGTMGRADARRGATNGGLATAGMVLGIIGIALLVVLFAVGAAIVASN